jgi:ATP-dependent DNA ligase
MGEHTFNHGMVFDGELLTINESGKFNPRTISNGIFNKCVRNTISEDEAKTLHVTLWDCIPLEDFKNEYSQLEYAFRFESLSSKLKQFTSSKVSLIPTRIVHSLEQANQHYQELLAAGEEGSILKDRSMLWENKRSKKQLKLKSEVSGEFVVTGYNVGEGKLVGNLGSLYIESADGKIVAAMSGFSLKLRSEIWANITNSPVKYSMVESGSEVEYFAQPGDTDININSIIECEYNQLVKGKDNEIYSLFLPRFKCVRSDKEVANTLEELLK